MMKRRGTTGLALAAFVVAWWGLAASASAAEMASPEMLASNCFNCHGPNGHSLGIIDEIGSLPAKRIADTLKSFKSGEKPATIMDRIAKGYSDAEIEAIAQYIQTVNK